MTCPCGAWEFRDLTLAEGLSATERFCPHCRRHVLLVSRGAERVGMVELRRRTVEALADALAGVGLRAAEVARLVTLAHDRAS